VRTGVGDLATFEEDEENFLYRMMAESDPRVAKATLRRPIWVSELKNFFKSMAKICTKILNRVTIKL